MVSYAAPLAGQNQSSAHGPERQLLGALGRLVVELLAEPFPDASLDCFGFTATLGE